MSDPFADMIKVDEGLRLKPYEDTVGKLTIGYGRNLDDVGISLEEAEALLGADIARSDAALKVRLPWVFSIDDVRRDVLRAMAFNMGIGGLIQFTRTLASAQAKQWGPAAEAMLQSQWAKQVGPRATRASHDDAFGDAAVKLMLLATFLAAVAGAATGTLSLLTLWRYVMPALDDLNTAEAGVEDVVTALIGEVQTLAGELTTAQQSDNSAAVAAVAQKLTTLAQKGRDALSAVQPAPAGVGDASTGPTAGDGTVTPNPGGTTSA